MAVEIFNSGNFENAVLQSSEPVLVDFWATWCGPCRMVGPVVEELAEAYNGKLKVGKVNVDENRELSKKFNVMNIPTLAIFKDGVEVQRMVGFSGKQHLQQFIETNL